MFEFSRFEILQSGFWDTGNMNVVFLSWKFMQCIL